MSTKAVCFDFDGTLGYVTGTDGHYGLYVRAAAEHGIAVSAEALRAAPLDDAWRPWQTPQGIDHSAASVSEQSFLAVRTALHRYRLRAAGVNAGATILETVGNRIAELEAETEHYRLFDDARPVLERLARQGVASLIVSNHIWVLPEIVESLGIGELVATVLTSARTGYRKPHSRMYAAALEAAGCGAAEILFTGDSHPSDVDGPHAAGMRAVLLDRDGGSAPEDEDGGADVIHSLAEITL